MIIYSKFSVRVQYFVRKQGLSRFVQNEDALTFAIKYETAKIVNDVPLIDRNN